MDRNPAKDANRKAKREMQEAVGRVIDEKKGELIGTKEAEEKVAADLNEAAHKDSKKRQHQPRSTAKGSGPRIRTGSQCVTQITVVESEPEKQAEALSLMTERAHFMARQPGFIVDQRAPQPRWTAYRQLRAVEEPRTIAVGS